MSTSVGAAIREAIVGAALVPNSQVYLDNAPERTPPPYITMNDTQSVTVETWGDSRPLFYIHDAQIDLWMTRAAEDLDIVLDLKNLLDGANYAVDGGHVMHGVVNSFERIPEPMDSNLTHWAFTLTLKHGATVI